MNAFPGTKRPKIDFLFLGRTRSSLTVVCPIYHRTDIWILNKNQNTIVAYSSVTSICRFFSNKNESKIFSSLNAQIQYVAPCSKKKVTTAKKIVYYKRTILFNAMRHTRTLFLPCLRELWPFCWSTEFINCANFATRIRWISICSLLESIHSIRYCADTLFHSSAFSSFFVRGILTIFALWIFNGTFSERNKAEIEKWSQVGVECWHISCSSKAFYFIFFLTWNLLFCPHRNYSKPNKRNQFFTRFRPLILNK